MKSHVIQNFDQPKKLIQKKNCHVAARVPQGRRVSHRHTRRTTSNNPHS